MKTLLIDIKKRIYTASGEKELYIKTTIKEGITGVFGSSGEGKSTLLNVLAGLEQAEVGNIVFGNKTWFNSEEKLFIPSQARKVAYILQTENLFPHLTVEENIRFPLNKEENKQLDLSLLLEQVDLLGFEEIHPHKLSGGQKQRVVLARTMAYKCDLLLLDEPFSALDWEIKQRLLVLIKQLQKEYKFLVLLVSHDPLTLLNLCNQVVWLENHKVSKQVTISDFKLELINRGYSFME